MEKLVSLVFTICMVFFISTTSAQTNHGSISGKTDNEKKLPLEGTSVSLLRAKDSALVKIAITDKNGEFLFENLKKDTFLITASHIGMVKYKSAPIILTQDSFLISLPVIELTAKNSELLREVEVTAARPFVEMKIDRVVVSPEALISNAGANAMEVLDKSPGVQVDISGAITLKGKEGVMIFVDDKPTHLSRSDLANYLKSLPGSAIDVIEIMSNPPAKYDAAGNAGIINIKLKKIKLKGVNGSFNTSYGQGTYARNSNSLNMNYRINKFNFFGIASYNITNDYQNLAIERHYLNADESLNSVFRQDSYIKNWKSNPSLRVGLDYYASKKSTLGIVLYGFDNSSTQKTPSNASLFSPSLTLDSTISAYSWEKERKKQGSVNLNYNYKFDSLGKELTINADHIAYRFNTDQSLVTNVFFPDHTLSSEATLLGNLPTRIDIQTEKADYSNPFKKGGTFEAGVKSSYITTDNVANFFDQNNGNLTVDNELTNHFKYKENISAAYISFNRGFKRLTVQAGLRFENTSVQGDQTGNALKPDSSFKTTYRDLFPTFYLSYKLDSTNKNRLGFSYGRRIQRPNYQDLNPFTYPIDKFTYFAGNPFLKPTFSQNLELSHTYKNIITTTLQYSYIKDVIQETIEQNDSLFTSRPGNISTQINMGISVNATLKPAKWWTIQVYTEVINNRFKGTLYNDQLNSNATYWMISGSNQFQISKLWNAELGGYIKTRSVQGQFIAEPLQTMRVALQRKIFKQAGSLKLTWSDVFYSFQPRGTIQSISNAIATYHNYLDSRIVTLAFSYRFNKGKSLRARRSGASDAEMGRVNN
jgi:iron complex outermembrane recepter protein